MTFSKNEVDIDSIISILDKESIHWDVPVVTLIAMQSKDPFKVLLSTIISLRTKDEVTIEASKKIYKLLEKPQDISNISIKQIQDAIYPCGFYKRKSEQIYDICIKLNKEFNSIVPKEIDTLLTFKGIGRKTANLILSEGYQIPAMCVDTHVHRISNRFGYINTKNPDESEMILRNKLDKKYWIRYNSLLVAFGQHLCKPISPFCSKCPVINLCKQKNIIKFR